MATKIADTLRKSIKRAKGVEAGTVVRFEMCFEKSLLRMEEAKRYVYAAIWVAGRWWLTGDRGIDGVRWYANEAFVEFLATDERVENVEVAVEFESVD